MKSILEREEILRAVIAGIPKVAREVAAVPPEERAGVLDAAERSYLQTTKDMGYTENDARPWVSAVMDRLRAEVEAGDAERMLLEKLYEEVARFDPGAGQKVPEISGRGSDEVSSLIEIYRWLARKAIN